MSSTIGDVSVDSALLRTPPSRTIDATTSWFRLGLLIAVHAGGAVIGLAIDRWYVWLAVWAVQAVNMLGMVAMTHEAVHSHYVGSRRANRVIGTIAGLVLLTNFEIYKSRHIGHHADTCGPDDTEGEPYKFTARWQILAAFATGGIAYILSLPMLGFWVSFGGRPSWATSAGARRRIRINQLWWLATVAALIAIATVDLRSVAFVWLIPVALFLSGPFVFVLMPEHYDAPGPGIVTSNTRTCVSNPLMRFIFLNTNLHTAHHDKPIVPWTGLPAHHENLEPRIDNEWVFSGYWAFYRFMWRNVGRPAASESVA